MNIAFCQMVFPASDDDQMIFRLHFAYVVYHINWFVDIEPSMHPGNKSHFIMVYDLFNVLLSLVC